MEYLSLIFAYDLPNYLFVKRPTRDELNYKCTIDNFDIELTLVADDNWSTGNVNSNLTTYGIRTINFLVRKQETQEPPPITIDENGIRDLSVQSPYFNERLQSYISAAIVALNRVIFFFKYKLQNPLLTELNPSPNDFEKVQWQDETGKVLRRGINIFYVQGIPGISHEKLSSRELVIDDDAELKLALESPIIPELYEELLSNAQSAAFQENLRRAVLELAIACEVIIYQTFFGESSPASEAFDFLVVEKYVQITPKDLIHKVAKRAFGESFKDKYSQHWNDIDHLFSCRNKVAHRGQLKYVSNEKTIEVDRKIFAQWWQSVDVLIKWLKEQSDK